MRCPWGWALLSGGALGQPFLQQGCEITAKLFILERDRKKQDGSKKSFFDLSHFGAENSILVARNGTERIPG